MSPTGRYFLPEETTEHPTVDGLDSDESILGYYRNPEPWQSAWLVFTDKAIYSKENERTTKLRLTDVVGYDSPKSKRDVGGVTVRTPDGFRFLRAAGSFGPTGNQKDAFCLINVLLTLARRNARAK